MAKDNTPVEDQVTMEDQRLIQHEIHDEMKNSYID